MAASATRIQWTQIERMQVYERAKELVTSNPNMIHHSRKMFLGAQKILPAPRRRAFPSKAELVEMVTYVQPALPAKVVVPIGNVFADAERKLELVSQLLESHEALIGRVTALETQVIRLTTVNQNMALAMMSPPTPAKENNGVPKVVIVGGPHDLADTLAPMYGDTLELIYIHGGTGYIDKLNAQYGKVNGIILYNGPKNGLEAWVTKKRKPTKTELFMKAIESQEALYSLLDYFLEQHG